MYEVSSPQIAVVTSRPAYARFAAATCPVLYLATAAVRYWRKQEEAAVDEVAVCSVLDVGSLVAPPRHRYGPAPACLHLTGGQLESGDTHSLLLS